MSPMIRSIELDNYNAQSIPELIKITFTTGAEGTYHLSVEGAAPVAASCKAQLNDFQQPKYEFGDQTDGECSFESVLMKWKAQLRSVDLKYRAAIEEAEQLFRSETAETRATSKNRQIAIEQKFTRLSKEMLRRCRRARRGINTKIKAWGNSAWRLKMVITWLRETGIPEMLETAKMLELHTDFITRKNSSGRIMDGYLSHVPKDSAYACRNIKDTLLKRATFWYKSADPIDVHGTIEGIRDARLFILVLTKQYFKSINCLFDYCVATIMDKRIITIAESDPLHGGGPTSSFMIPQLFRHILKHEIIEMNANFWKVFITRLHKRMINTIFTGDVQGDLVPPGSILRQSEREWLIAKLAKARWKFGERLFASSKDGESVRAFHEKCDGKGATITVVETANNWVFGGFSPVSWCSHGAHITAERAWLFQLREGPYRSINLKSCHKRVAVYHDMNSGPCFGRGDIAVHYQQHTCYCKKAEYQSGILSQSNNDLIKFQLSKYEVFQCTRN